MERHVAVDGPLDLERTLLGLQAIPASPSVHADAAGYWRATYTVQGPATLLIRRAGNGAAARAWGPGAEAALDSVPDLIGAGDTPRFPASDPIVARLQRRFPGIRLGKTGAVFESALPTIVAQKVTGKGSKNSFRHLVSAFGEPAPGPVTLRMPPRPEDLADLPYEDYHRFGIERRRAEIIRFAARRARRLEEVVTMPLEAAYQRLLAFPGFGPWTVGKVAGTALGDPDAVPVGDYNLPSLVSWNLAREERGDDERMLELLSPYAGHRGRVLRLLKAGGATPPRFGPRLAVRSIEHI